MSNIKFITILMCIALFFANLNCVTGKGGQCGFGVEGLACFCAAFFLLSYRLLFSKDKIKKEK